MEGNVTTTFIFIYSRLTGKRTRLTSSSSVFFGTKIVLSTLQICFSKHKFANSKHKCVYYIFCGNLCIFFYSNCVEYLTNLFFEKQKQICVSKNKLVLLTIHFPPRFSNNSIFVFWNTNLLIQKHKFVFQIVLIKCSYAKRKFAFSNTNAHS